MNYKKLVLIAVAGAAITLAGCGNSATNMSFEQTYNAFRDNHTSDMVKMATNLSHVPALTEKGEYTISGSMASGFALHLDIDAASTITNSGLDTDSSVGLSGKLLQEGADDTIGIDSSILFKMVKGQSYLNVEKLSVTSSKGNPQISMIGALASIVTNKWISLASSGTSTPALQGLSLANLYALPSTLMQTIKAHPIFTETSKEMIDGNPVYHIALSTTGLYMVAKDLVNNDAIKIFLNGTTFTDEELQSWAETFVANASFDGTLTAYSTKNIVLTINTLNVDETEAIRGKVDQKTTHFDVLDRLATGNDTVLGSADVTEKENLTTFGFTVPSEELNVNGQVNVTDADSNGIAYTLAVAVMHPSLSLQLNGSVKIKAQSKATAIEAPASSQTIDSLLEGFGSLMGGSTANSLSGTISAQ